MELFESPHRKMDILTGLMRFNFREKLNRWHPFSLPSINAGTQILWGHCVFSNLSRHTRSTVLGGVALNMRASGSNYRTAQLNWQSSQCHSLCTLFAPTHTQSHVKIAGRQLNRTGGGCGGRGENLRKTGEAGPENLSESRQPCQQQRGWTPDANYADKWCWQLVRLAAIYSLGDPNYRHSWRTNRQWCRVKGGKLAPSLQNKSDLMLVDISRLYYLCFVAAK